VYAAGRTGLLLLLLLLLLLPGDRAPERCWSTADPVL